MAFKRGIKLALHLSYLNILVTERFYKPIIEKELYVFKKKHEKFRKGIEIVKRIKESSCK